MTNGQQDVQGPNEDHRTHTERSQRVTGEAALEILSTKQSAEPSKQTGDPADAKRGKRARVRQDTEAPSDRKPMAGEGADKSGERKAPQNAGVSGAAAMRSNRGSRPAAERGTSSGGGPTKAAPQAENEPGQGARATGASGQRRTQQATTGRQGAHEKTQQKRRETG